MTWDEATLTASISSKAVGSEQEGMASAPVASFDLVVEAASDEWACGATQTPDGGTSSLLVRRSLASRMGAHAWSRWIHQVLRCGPETSRAMVTRARPSGRAPMMGVS